MAGTFILKPYVRRKDPGRFGLLLRGLGLVLLAAFYGLMCSVLPMQLLVIPLLPILIMAGFILWMLPDTGGIRADILAKLMLWYAGLNIVWPFYVAFDVPGLPWVTPTRIVIGIVTTIFLLNLASSAEFRGRLTDTISVSKHVRRLFWGFCALTAASLVFSATPIFSINKFINNQIYWTMFFMLSAFLATRPGFVTKLSKVLVVTIIAVAMAGIVEAKLERVIWIDHLPGFLTVDQGMVETFAKSQSRAGTDVYRVRGTLGISLYYAEYLALMLPLVLHAMFQQTKLRWSILLGLGAFAVMVNMYVTNARSGVIGALIALVLYFFFAVYRLRRNKPSSLAASAAVWAYPMGLAGLVILTLTWRRLRVMTLGGGQQQASTDARSAQWASGWPKIFDHPFGHGVARAAETLGYTNQAGFLTIDSYYLSLLLEYGPLGLLTFVLMFGLAAWFGFRMFITARNSDELVAGPLAIGLVSFVIIKSVLSSEINIPIAFMMAGCIIGLMWQRAHAGAAMPEPAPPADTTRWAAARAPRPA